MTGKRVAIPKIVKEKVLGEYRHRCAICGSDKPQLHHIDKDPSNNELSNIIPLCPNCHLTDQHDPTSEIDIGRLRLFRKYKTPVVLSSQFVPLYRRFSFLYAIRPDSYTAVLESDVVDLIDFVRYLKMGEFYCKKIENLLSSPPCGTVWTFGEDDSKNDARIEEHRREFIHKLTLNKFAAEALLIELLRYQDWRYERAV